ncbi:hypothetical protein F5883DRAFT_124849 [Diaporthe sp. PMI_573]|nr:hypothetical protein F5883DRAFT_124849 [Diaporthaceae sp. PMI_573]
MDAFNAPEPQVPDYYADLGLAQQASSREIKVAFRTLAKEHHPDKKAPGKSIDAQDFRKIREAYECLIDYAKRSEYDASYFNLQDQWTRYQECQESRRKDEERRRAEKEKEAAEAEITRRMEEERRAAREKAERERAREERVRQAEERSREAGRKARQQQEQAAKERLQREKERDAEKRSEEAARRMRVEQEQVARERLKTILIEEKQEAVRQNWANVRQAAESRVTERSKTTPSRSPECIHPKLGWPRKKGKSSCVFCGETRINWSFYCPDCNVTACPGCKTKYCKY